MPVNNLIYGMKGAAVVALQTVLKKAGFDPGQIDGDFGAGTLAAVQAFQRSERLEPDGVVGPLTWEKLEFDPASLPPSTAPAPEPVPSTAGDDTRLMTVQTVARMMPAAPLGNIKKYLPMINLALAKQGLADPVMFCMAIATISAETGGFAPISEGISRYNTSPNGHPFDLYDFRKDLGNNHLGDGALGKGRGFIQLTGLSNYAFFGPKVGVNLITSPESANDPTVAADLLALFLKSKEAVIRTAVRYARLDIARRAVNGGSHGLDAFTQAFHIGRDIFRFNGT